MNSLPPVVAALVLSYLPLQYWYFLRCTNRYWRSICARGAMMESFTRARALYVREFNRAIGYDYSDEHLSVLDRIWHGPRERSLHSTTWCEERAYAFLLKVGSLSLVRELVPKFFHWEIVKRTGPRYCLKRYVVGVDDNDKRQRGVGAYGRYSCHEYRIMYMRNPARSHYSWNRYFLAIALSLAALTLDRIEFLLGTVLHDDYVYTYDIVARALREDRRELLLWLFDERRAVNRWVLPAFRYFSTQNIAFERVDSTSVQYLVRRAGPPRRTHLRYRKWFEMALTIDCIEPEGADAPRLIPLESEASLPWHWVRDVLYDVLYRHLCKRAATVTVERWLAISIVRNCSVEPEYFIAQMLDHNDGEPLSSVRAQNIALVASAFYGPAVSGAERIQRLSEGLLRMYAHHPMWFVSTMHRLEEVCMHTGVGATRAQRQPIFASSLEMLRPLVSTDVYSQVVSMMAETPDCYKRYVAT